jgi:hypothetical protein
MMLSGREGANLINIQYGVMFGVVFSFSFYLGHQPSSHHVIPAIYSENTVLFVSLLCYCIVSWVTANLLLHRLVSCTPFIIVTWTFAIWSLGVVVVMVNSLGSVRYLLLGCYVSTAALYDLIAYRDICYRTTALSAIVWLLLAGFSVPLGLMLLIPSFFVVSELAKSAIDFGIIPLAVVWVFLAIRIARFFYISRSEDHA